MYRSQIPVYAINQINWMGNSLTAITNDQSAVHGVWNISNDY